MEKNKQGKKGRGSKKEKEQGIRVGGKIASWC